MVFSSRVESNCCALYDPLVVEEIASLDVITAVSVNAIYTEGGRRKSRTMLSRGRGLELCQPSQAQHSDLLQRAQPLYSGCPFTLDHGRGNGQ